MCSVFSQQSYEIISCIISILEIKKKELEVKKFVQVNTQCNQDQNQSDEPIFFFPNKEKDIDVWHNNSYKYIKLLIHSRYSQDVIFPVCVIFLTKNLSWHCKNPYEQYRACICWTCTELTGNTMFCFCYSSVLSRWTRNEWLITCLRLALFMKSHTINNRLFSGRSNSQTLKMARSFQKGRRHLLDFLGEIMGCVWRGRIWHWLWCPPNLNWQKGNS